MQYAFKYAVALDLRRCLSTKLQIIMTIIGTYRTLS